jgi:N-acetylmuramoyl-L-alanine amidase
MKPLIKEGERSSQVIDVQARLRALGISVEDEPGFFGPSTKQAVRSLQQQRGLLADGIVGPHTWNELVEAGWRLGDRALYLAFPPLRGDDVSVLQSRLNALGFDAGREDGIFGRDTDRALRAFQREYGVREDGILGPKTHEALSGLRADRPLTAAALREELRRSEGHGGAGLLVALDPGHGGDDRGERGPNGSYEADLCWELARLIAERLPDLGALVRFTRTEIESPDVTERARRANEIEADIFLSLHLNSNAESAAQGASTYYFPKSHTGETLAEAILSRLTALGISDCRSHARSYPILRETRMPAVLIEPGFITNPDDEKRLDQSDGRVAIADAIVLALFEHYAEP